METRSGSTRRLIADVSLDAGIANQLWRDPDALMARGAMLKDGDRCTLVRIETSGIRFVLKRYNRRGLLHSILHWPLRSRARWCWVNAGRVRAAGLCTPGIFAMVETRIGPLRDRSFLLSEYIEGRILLDVINDASTSGARLEYLANAFAEIWSELGRAQLGHRDMKATNFILDESNRMWLIDLDGMRKYRSQWLFARRRRKDWRRFMRNWQDRPEAARVFRARIDTNGPPGGG